MLGPNSKWLSQTFGDSQELTMLGKFPLTVGAWIILFSEVSAGDAETIGIYASKEDASNNDTTSWALLNSSAIVDTVDDFTACVRFRVRMFPNLPAFFSFGPGEEVDSGNKSLRFYLGYSSNMNGPSRSGFHIKFVNSTETLWAPMMDPDKSQEREIFLPNRWSHLCLSFSSDTRMIRYVLVSKIGMTRRVRPIVSWSNLFQQDGTKLEGKVVPPKFKNVALTPNFLTQFRIQTKKGFMFGDLNIWNRTLEDEDMIDWTTCK